MDSIEWTETHDSLQEVMKRELETMRKLLDNINLEEQFILKQDKKYWGSMMEERSLLIEELSKIQKNRLFITEKLEMITHHANSALEELLPAQHTSSWEVLSLRDQMATLMDRMHLQTSRNDMLLHLAKARELVPLPKSKKKISIATLSSDDYKERSEPRP